MYDRLYNQCLAWKHFYETGKQGLCFVSHNVFIILIEFLLKQNVIKRFANGDKKVRSKTWRASEYVPGVGFGIRRETIRIDVLRVSL